MPIYTKEQLEQQYEKLPDALKDAIFSVEIAEKMFEIGKKHGLTMEKTGFAAEETGFVILGLLRPREFASSLASRLNIDTDKAAALASDINHQVFFPLREALKETHQIDVGEGAIHAETILPRKPAPAPPEARGAAAASISPPIAPAASAPTAPSAPIPPQKIIPQEPSAATKPPVPTPAPQATTLKPAPIILAPRAPMLGMTDKESPVRQARIAEKNIPGPIILEPLKTPPSSPASEAVKAPPAPKTTEPKKPPPIILRQKFTDDLQKEVAPLISGLSTPAPSGFLTREETERLVAEKLAQQKPFLPQDTPRLTTAPPAPVTPAPTPPPPQMPQAPPLPTAPPMPPSVPLENIPRPASEGETPMPITLEQLPGAPAPMPSASPALGTAKVPALDLRNAPKPPVGKKYDGFDPYKESVE